MKKSAWWRFSKSLLKKNRWQLLKWTLTDGLEAMTEGYPLTEGFNDPTTLLTFLRQDSQRAVFALLDFHPHLADPLRNRLLKEIAQQFVKSGSTIVFVSHRLEVPPELRGVVLEFEPSVPNLAQLKEMVTEVAHEWSKLNLGKKVRTDETLLEQLVRNLQGLTSTDARRMARQAIFNDGAITAEDLTEVMRARYELLENSGAVSFEHDVLHFSDIAGFENLKTWVTQREVAFNLKTNVWKLTPPKGVLLLGVQGCGKSTAAKAIAATWKMPLLRFDFGAVYNKFVGESERLLRESLRAAEALAPCVLWMDEIEKGLGSDNNDGGTSRRILGQLLTWMAEKKSQVFLVATANDIEQLPPELIRKGRFDEIFFVDLPTSAEREKIFEIHLKKRSLDPSKFSIQQLAASSEGFAGAEIEQAVISALYRALAQKAMVGDRHILEELSVTKPLSIVMGERVQALREWAKSRTVPV